MLEQALIMTQSSPQPFSDYVVYVDESGDHGLKSMDKTYPIFVLAFCVFNKQQYRYHFRLYWRTSRLILVGYSLPI